MIFYYLVCLAVAGLVFLLLRRWEAGVEADLKEGARAEYDLLRRKRPTLLEGVDPATFEAIHVRVQRPRYPRYLFAVVAVFFLASPVMLGLLSGAAWLAQETGLVPQPGDVATEIYFDSGNASIIRKANPETLAYIVQGWAGFYYFFGMLAFWMLTVWVVMRRYHLRSPGSLEEELIRAR